MITFLDGKLVNALPTQAIVDVGGVGYEVFIPLSSYDKLPAAGQSIRILTHLAVREDAHVLYGFMTPAERVAAAWEAASAAHAPTPEQEQANEAVLALIALGYKQVEAHKAVRDLQDKGEAESAEELVKLVLKRMAAGR